MCILCNKHGKKSVRNTLKKENHGSDMMCWVKWDWINVKITEFTAYVVA